MGGVVGVLTAMKTWRSGGHVQGMSLPPTPAQLLQRFSEWMFAARITVYIDVPMAVGVSPAPDAKVGDEALGDAALLDKRGSCLDGGDGSEGREDDRGELHGVVNLKEGNETR